MVDAQPSAVSVSNSFGKMCVDWRFRLAGKNWRHLGEWSCDCGLKHFIDRESPS